jgi:hypothetical protein
MIDQVWFGNRNIIAISGARRNREIIIVGSAWKRVQNYVLMRIFQGDAEHGVPVRAWHWPPAKQETPRHSHVSGTQHYTIQSCFRYTALPFRHVSGKQHYIQTCFRYTAQHSDMFQVHLTTIQSCFR